MSNAQRRALSPELSEIAHKYCNEEEDSIRTNIAALRTWIRKSAHLKARTNRQLLLAFLRCCQFNLDDTKKRIDSYYALRNIFPEVLGARLVNDLMLGINRCKIHVIPYKAVSPCGPRVIISQYKNYEPKLTNAREIFKLFFMLLEILAIEDDNASIASVIYVIDARDVTAEQMLQYDAMLLQKTYMMVDECLPLKFKEIHLINMRTESRKLFSFVTHFLADKLPFKFIVHKKAEDLYDYLPRDAMPIEYGGHNGYQAEALDVWEKKLRAYADYFAEDASYGTYEKLRVGHSTGGETDGLRGLNGYFGKLRIE